MLFQDRSLVRYQVPRYSGWKLRGLPSPTPQRLWSDTKYRVIADGNVVSATSGAGDTVSDTKYRVIADGNGHLRIVIRMASECSQIPSTAL